MRRAPDIEIEQNLRDAGCDEETIRRYYALEAAECGLLICRREQVRLLRVHRRGLLDQLHTCQRELDCLDYLLYRLRCGRTEES